METTIERTVKLELSDLSEGDYFGHPCTEDQVYVIVKDNSTTKYIPFQDDRVLVFNTRTRILGTFLRSTVVEQLEQTSPAVFKII